MKKAILIFIFFIQLFWGKHFLQAQTTEYWDRINHALAHIDTSHITTGILADYGIQFLPPWYYNGDVWTLEDYFIND